MKSNIERIMKIYESNECNQACSTCEWAKYHGRCAFYSAISRIYEMGYSDGEESELIRHEKQFIKVSKEALEWRKKYQDIYNENNATYKVKVVPNFKGTDDWAIIFIASITAKTVEEDMMRKRALDAALDGAMELYNRKDKSDFTVVEIKRVPNEEK